MGPSFRPGKFTAYGSLAATAYADEPVGTFLGRFLLPGGRPRRLICDISLAGVRAVCRRSRASLSANILLMSFLFAKRFTFFLRKVVGFLLSKYAGPRHGEAFSPPPLPMYR
jgi:hypothetical protein